ncbi:MAG: glycosyltransferase [Alphaproteobacteria bacterium]|nr:glycosyltransferase [Alphaproteobacteria bacterium]
MLPMLSIVVPVHNVARYLPSTLDSILEQRCAGIEVVLVDDRSTDESGAICDRYAEQYPGVRVLHLPENQGVAQARNQGLAAATGDYILFVDGDDCLLPGSLERVRGEIGRLGAVDIVICRYHSESKVLSNAAMFPQGAAGCKLDAEVVLRHLTGTGFYLDHCWPYVINRALIERNKVRFIPSMIAEDAEYIVRILTLASSAAYHEGEFYLYRERDGSLKNSKGVASTVSFLIVAQAMRRVVERDAKTVAQREFVEAQVRHTLGVFSARLSLLNDPELDAMSAELRREDLPVEITGASDGSVADALIAYRDRTDGATLALVSAAQDRPVYIYCAGPTAQSVIRTLRRQRYDVRAIVDDNTAFRGRALLDVPIVGGEHFETLSAPDRAAAFIVICIQKWAAYQAIVASLKKRGFQPEQIVHRMF